MTRYIRVLFVENLEVLSALLSIASALIYVTRKLVWDRSGVELQATTTDSIIFIAFVVIGASGLIASKIVKKAGEAPSPIIGIVAFIAAFNAFIRACTF